MVQRVRMFDALADGGGSLTWMCHWALDAPGVVDLSSAGGWLTHLAGRSR